MFLILLLLAAAPLVTWNFRTARMEGASGNVREAAANVKNTAEGIVAAGRLKDVAVLRSQADLLHQKVVSAGLAAANLDQVDGGVEALRQVSTGAVGETSPASTPAPEVP